MSKPDISGHNLNREYEQLASLLGIKLDEIKEAQCKNKWRRVEIINELKALNSEVNSRLV